MNISLGYVYFFLDLVALFTGEGDFLGGEAGFLASWLGVSADVGTGGGGTFGFETSFSGNGDFGFGGCTFNTLG